MNGRIFLDTNCIIYLYSQDDTLKRDKVISYINYYHSFISTQVLSETVNVLYKKFKASSSSVSKVISELSKYLVIVPVDIQVITKAIQIKENYKYVYYDSQIIASSIISMADMLLTEDLQNGQNIGHLKIINPFI